MTLGEGGPGVSVSGSHERASRSTAAIAYDDEKGWHTTSGSRTQSGSGSGNVGTTAGYGIVGGSGAGFSYEFSLNSTSGPTGASTTSGSATATLSWSGTGDTGQTGSGITARARYGDGEGWQIVSVGPATTAGSGDDSSLNSLPRERPDLPLGRWTDQDRAAAFFADLVYTWEGSGFRAIGVDYNPEHGFAASLFQDSDGTYYLAFRGTEFYSWDDWRTNVRQGLGLSASQYQQAIELARRVKDALPKGARLILTVHSLDGGLASAASYDTGLDAITFNAATPNRHYTRGKVSGEIRSHVVIGDPLSVGRTTGIVNRDLPGTVIPHMPRVANTHAMDNFPFYR